MLQGIESAAKGRLHMTRTILTYGLISGFVIILGMIGTIVMKGDAPHTDVWLGYLIMLIGLSSILIGVKQYRDQKQGGVIKFTTAFMLGLGIALAAALAYVLVWEVYLAMTDYAFMDKYAEQMLAAKRAAGVTGAAYDKAVAEMEGMKTMYANPLLRLPMTFIEIFPVGLLVALVTAVLVRNPRFLPARSAPSAA
jgi:hypothetical protein